MRGRQAVEITNEILSIEPTRGYARKIEALLQRREALDVLPEAKQEIIDRLRVKWRGHKASIQPPLEPKPQAPMVLVQPTKPLKNLVELYPYQKRWIEDKSRFRIGSWSRQSGKSFCICMEGALVARSTRRVQIYLSRGERQSKELGEKAAAITKMLDIVAETVHGEFVADNKTKYLQLEIRFPNGNKMYFLPAKPETARGYAGDVYLDEFALQQDAFKIYAALYPTITRGFRVSITSTPQGQIGKFYEFAKSAGMVEGYERDPYSPWSAHRLDVYQAVMEGMSKDCSTDPSMQIHPDILTEIQEGFRRRGLNPTPKQLRVVAELRAGAEDSDLWASEYECAFLSSAKNYIPIELILDCESEDASEALPDYPLGGRTFLGIDVGRKVHRTVYWLLEEVGDVLVTRAVTVLNKRPFQDQQKLAREYMERCHVYKASVDATGMGMQIAEDLQRAYPGRVEPVTFTLQSKDVMYSLMRRVFEEKRYRIPASPIIRADINGIKRGVTRAGNIVFSAEESKEGHSDRAAALALATLSAQQPSAPPLTRDNFIGLGRPQRVRLPDIPDWESKDLSSLLAVHGSGFRRLM